LRDDECGDGRGPVLSRAAQHHDRLRELVIALERLRSYLHKEMSRLGRWRVLVRRVFVWVPGDYESLGFQIGENVTVCETEAAVAVRVPVVHQADDAPDSIHLEEVRPVCDEG
jgi:hypothetical protein